MPRFNSQLSLSRNAAQQGEILVEERHDDTSFEDVLSEAFLVMENRFAALDKDGAGMIMFRMLEAQLALHGFTDAEALKHVWEKVDRDKSGYLDFAEFLCLMFLWAGTGDYENILDQRRSCRVVEKAFQALEKMWTDYDTDKTRKFKFSELQRFFSEQMPESYDTSKEIIDTVFPLSDRQKGREMSFPRFMHLSE